MARGLAAALALVLLPGSAAAKDWVVDARGGADFSAIQPAIDASASGDTILVRSGRYPGKVAISGKQGLTIRGEPGALLVSPKQFVEGGISIDQSERITIEGLDASLKDGDALRIGVARDVQVRGCRFDGNEADEGIAIFRSQRVLVAGSRVMGFREAGIYIDQSSEIEVADTVVAENGSSGITVKSSAPVTLRADTITRHHDGPGVYVEGASKVAITRSIIVFNQRQIVGKPDEAEIIVTESFEEDPSFADLVKRDYRLRPSSPLAGEAASPETRVGALGVAAEVAKPYCPLPVDSKKNAIGSITPLGTSADGRFAYFDSAPFSPAEDATIEFVVYDPHTNARLFSERLSDFDPLRIEGLWAARDGYSELLASHGIDCSRPPRAEPMPVRLGENAPVQVEAARESDTAVSFFAWTEGRSRLRLGRFESSNQESLPSPLSPAAGFFRHPAAGLLTFVFVEQDSALFFTAQESALAPEKMGPRCGPQTAPADKDGFTHFVSADKALLREAPGRQAAALAELEHNDLVRILGDASCEEEAVSFRDESGRARRIADRWYRVATNINRVGWIHGSLIEPIAHQGHTGHVYALGFSRDGKLLASGGSEGIVLVWDVAKGIPRARLEIGADVRALAFDDRGRLAVGTDGGGAQVWDWATGKKVSAHAPELGRVKSVAFSPDSRLVASVHEEEQKVRVWRADTGALVAKSPEDPSGVSEATFVGNGAIAYSGSALWLWKHSGSDAPTKLAEKHHSFLVADSSGSTLLAARPEEDDHFDFVSFDPAKGSLQDTDIQYAEARAVRYLPARKRFAVATCDDGVVFWPPADKYGPSAAAKTCFSAAALGEAGRRVLLATEANGLVFIRDVEKPQVARELPVTRRNRE